MPALYCLSVGLYMNGWTSGSKFFQIKKMMTRSPNLIFLSYYGFWNYSLHFHGCLNHSLSQPKSHSSRLKNHSPSLKSYSSKLKAIVPPSKTKVPLKQSKPKNHGQETLFASLSNWAHFRKIILRKLNCCKEWCYYGTFTLFGFGPCLYFVWEYFS